MALERFVRVRLISSRLAGRLVEDCGQEVFTRVWRFRKGYQGTTEAEFWRWLRQICDNERRRILAREALRATSPLAGENLPDAGRAPLTSTDRTDDQVVLTEELAALQECLRSLEENRRRVIELVYFDPVLPERSIAELLGCSASNVHKFKREGLCLLRACLARKGIR